MISSGVTLRLRTRQLLGSRILMVAVCAWSLVFVALPLGNAAPVDPAGQSVAAAQPSTTAPQAAQQAKRREQIEQKKIDNPEAEDDVNIYRHSASVQKLAKMLGLPVETMSRWLEGLNFLLVWGFIVWFLARILPKTLRGRTERIQSQLQKARTVTEDANRRLASVEERLAQLDTEISGIKAQAHHEALEKEKQMRATLEQEKQSILDSSAQEIAAASSKAQSQLKRMTAELAVERAKHKIAVTAEADRSLVETFLVDLDRERRSGVN